jgi:cobalt/nickel transport system permease protein
MYTEAFDFRAQIPIPPMHTPDGFLNLPVAVVCYALAGIAVAYAVRRTSREIRERQVPLMGVMAAFIFAAQMLNFPVAGGTSGHLLGGALAAILLGPWAAILVLTSVLGIQALVFQDGGLIALGANVLNMAVIGVLVGYGTYHGLRVLLRGQRWGVLSSAFVAAWLSVFLASIACALELGASGTSSYTVVLPAMGGVHALIGIGEGLISAAALAFILATRRDLIEAKNPSTGVQS